MNFVLYHAACYDGYTAAYACFKHFGAGAQYIPVSYGKPPPEMTPGSTVYIVDFSYPRETMIELAESHQKVVVLDHHLSAQEALKDLEHPNLEIVFDMTRSGALITWQYFFPGEPVPYLICSVSDRDLWKFELDGSREIHTYLQSLPFDFAAWDQVCVELEIPYTRKAVIKAGETLVRFRDAQVKVICQQARMEVIGDHLVPCVNATLFWSEVGHELLTLYPAHPFSVSWFLRADGMRQYSLRSRKEFDCSVVAKIFQGGGHAQASGFTVTDGTDVSTGAHP